MVLHITTKRSDEGIITQHQNKINYQLHYHLHQIMILRI
ncbi:hypothetical protein A6A12_1333 [Vibrio anguillarum]|nr:hypothetical protein A6A12_1333 [Vibrio anguillarum]